MAYQYDVFVSYKREPYDSQLITPWLFEVLRRIEYWLKQELGGHGVRFFVDQKSVEVGARWPDTLRDALLRAKCLLPVWSPEYFQSSWCLAEWRSFLAREQLHREKDPRCRLIVPIKFHDGVWFPDEAKQVQQLDLCPYAATTEAFWRSPRADELDRHLMDFVPMLAEAVDSAPPFDPNWPIMAPDPAPPPTIPLARFLPLEDQRE